MNPWLQILTPEKLPPPAKKERIYNGVKAGSKPCARCKVAPREVKSYCRKCHNYYAREVSRKKYYADKAVRLQAGLSKGNCHA